MPISLNLKGRLGNHLFQYATLRNLSIIKGFDFYLFKLDDINIYNFENKSISIVVSLEKSLEYSQIRL